MIVPSRRTTSASIANSKRKYRRCSASIWRTEDWKYVLSRPISSGFSNTKFDPSSIACATGVFPSEIVKITDFRFDRLLRAMELGSNFVLEKPLDIGRLSTYFQSSVRQ